MRIAFFSPIIILVLTTLPTSLTSPPINRLNSILEVGCLPSLPDAGHRSTRHHIAPFPSHCLYLAQQLCLEPGPDTPVLFDRRPSSTFPEWPALGYPHQLVYQTCWVRFVPPQDPAPSDPPNLVTRALFADAIALTVRKCFTVDPGQESEGNVAAKMTDPTFVGLLTGYTVPNRLGSKNVTAVEEGFNGTELAEAWASLNGSAVGLVGGQSGTAGTGRVDVT